MTMPNQSFHSSHKVRWPLSMVIGAFLLSLGAAAQAQVVRCTDSKTGRITYTNGSCISGEAGIQVQQAQSRDEIAQERSQAASAVARSKAQMTLDEQERTRREERERKELEAMQRAQARNAANNRGDSTAACQQAKQRYNAVLAEASPDPATWGNRSLAAQRQMEMECLGASAYQQLEQNRALQPNAINRIWYGANGRPVSSAPSQHVPAMTNCNVFRCFDAQGNSHTRPWP